MLRFHKARLYASVENKKSTGGNMISKYCNINNFITILYYTKLINNKIRYLRATAYCYTFFVFCNIDNIAIDFGLNT